MNRIVLVLILVSAGFVQSAEAQGGYLGSKTAIYTYGEISSYQPFSLYAKPWRKIAGVGIARTVNRNLELSVSFQVTRGGLFASEVRGRDVRYHKHEGENNMLGLGGKIGFRRFRYTAGAISPIGKYWGMELSVDRYEVEDRIGLYYPSDGVVLEPFEMSYLKAQIWFKVGWQTIVGEHFLVGGEVKTGVIPLVFQLDGGNSSNYWTEGLIGEIVDVYTPTENGIIAYEFYSNLFVPEIHAAFLF